MAGSMNFVFARSSQVPQGGCRWTPAGTGQTSVLHHNWGTLSLETPVFSSELQTIPLSHFLRGVINLYFMDSKQTCPLLHRKKLFLPFKAVCYTNILEKVAGTKNYPCPCLWVIQKYQKPRENHLPIVVALTPSGPWLSSMRIIWAGSHKYEAVQGIV